MTTMHRHTPASLVQVALVLGVAILMGSCENVTGTFEIPNQDEPNVGALERNPTRAIALATAQGLVEGFRSGTEVQVSNPAHFGREGYYVDPARTRLDEFDDPRTPAGGIGWNTAYSFIRTGHTLLDAVEKIAEMPAAEREGVRGFAKTLEAYLLHTQIRTHGDFGIVVDTNRPLSEELAPIASESEAYDYIVARLDEAATHLGAAGGSFAFQLPSGYAGFNTPATFLLFNRALKARVLNERGDYPGALVAVGQSFLAPEGDLDRGVYNNYSTASGDRTNPFFDPSGRSYVADTLMAVDAQRRGDGSPDLRLTEKTEPGEYRSNTGVTSNLRWTIYNTNAAPIPIIRNEELILIRAEARLFTGDRAGAMADLNRIRTESGGLEPLAADPGEAALEDELLYNRRYSLVFEFGHRWVDLRRFDRLTELRGPRGAGDLVFDKLPFPSQECDQRNQEPLGCRQVDGFRTVQ